MVKLQSTSSNKLLATLLGIVLAIMPIQRIPIVGLVGLALTLGIAIYVTVMHPKSLLTVPKSLWIPLGIMLVMMMITPGNLYSKAYGLSMICLFNTVRILGPTVLRPLGIGAVIGVVSIVITNALAGFERTGGIYHSQNYNMVVGVIVLSIVLWRWPKQWLLIPIMLLGMLFTGAEEALVVVVFLLVVVLIRRDWDKRLLLILGGLIVCILILIPFNIPQRLWKELPLRVVAVEQTDSLVMTNGRWDDIMTSLKDFSPLGHGYAPDNTKQSSAHDVPVRVLYELGPIGLLCWLWLILYGLWKTTWKYAFTAVLGLSIFDHFMWTQLAPYFFVLLGVCTYYTTSDKVFAKHD